MHLTMTSCSCEKSGCVALSDSLPFSIPEPDFTIRERSLQSSRTCVVWTVLLLLPVSLSAEENRFRPLPSHDGSTVQQNSGSFDFPSFDSGDKTPSRKLSRQNRTITPTGQSRNPQTGPSGSAWRTIGSLIVVIGLILLGAKLWRKHSPAASLGLPAEAIEILGRKPIEQRASVYLIRCGSRILVVGSSADGLQTLAEITDPVEVDTLAGLCRRSEPDNRFGQSLLSFFNRRPNHHPNPDHPDPSLEEDDEDNSMRTARLNIDPSTNHDQSLEAAHG